MTKHGGELASQQGIDIVKSDTRISQIDGGIEIKSNGKPINLEVTEQGLVYLLLDCSGSMSGRKIEQAKKGAIDFAKSAQKKGYSTGLISFESSAEHICKPQRNYENLFSFIKKIRVGNSTNMAHAISMATQKLGAKKCSRVIVLVTDGYPDSQELTLEAANKAKSMKIEIITIATEDADRAFLKKISTTDKLAVNVQSKHLAKGIVSTAQMLPKVNNRMLHE